MGVITLIPTLSIMQNLTPLLAVLSVCQAAGLPALALGAGGVVNSGLHSSVVNHGSLGHGGLHSSVGSLGHGSVGHVGTVSHSAPLTAVSSVPVVSTGAGHDHYEQPDPFTFEYGVQDDHYHTDFSEHRAGDAEGNIVGEYQVALPDGRVQYVTYRADGHYGGTVMEVRYEGEARHPEVVHATPVVHEVHDVVHEVPSYHGY